MVAKMPYQSLNHSLVLLKKQVLEGIPYAIKELPKFETPEQIFYWFKQRTKYKSDPPGVELFQSLPTFFENNYWGKNKPGYGDCDCLSISLLSVLLASGFFNCGIVLVGRNKKNAVHIYVYVDDNRRRKYMDLTNQNFDYERDYSHRQEINFNLTKQQKQKIKNMDLQLADKGAANINNMSNHIFLPSKGVFLREDLADNMPFDEFTRGLTKEGYNPFQIEELAAKRAERKAEKTVKKETKKETKATKKAAPSKRQAAKQKRVETKQTQKTERASAKSSRPRRELTPEQRENLTSLVKKVGGAAAAKFDIDIDGETPGYQTPGYQTPRTQTQGSKTNVPGAETETETETKILGMPKKIAIGVGIGVAVLVVGGIALSKKNS